VKLKKVISLVLVVVLMLGCVSLVACGGGETETTTPSNGETSLPSDGETTPPTGDETLDEILARGADLPSVKYDQVLTSPGEPTVTWKVWVEGQKSRIEMSAEGQTVIMLIDFDAGIMYMYDPAENVAIKMDLSGFEGIATEASEDILNFNPTIIGTETWDGKVCLVVEYTAVIEGVESKIKQWIWEEYGFPIRMETTSGGESAVMECRNIEFGDIPNNVFELPDGVEIMGW
jgi:outer membrane lipoprotein-sorting protein